MSQKYLFSPNLTRSSRFLGFREPCRSSAGGRRRTGGASRRAASGRPSEGGGRFGQCCRARVESVAGVAGCACGLQFSVSGGWRGGFPWAASRCPQQGDGGFLAGCEWTSVGRRRTVRAALPGAGGERGGSGGGVGRGRPASRDALAVCSFRSAGMARGLPVGREWVSVGRRRRLPGGLPAVVGGGKRERTLPVKGEFLLVKSDATPAPRGPFVVPWKFTS